jgi:hypothetical protein
MTRAGLLGRLFLIVAATAALATMFVSILDGYGHLFANVDAFSIFVSFEASRRIGSVFDLQSFGFDHGFGTFLWPTLLDPSWWVLSLTDSVTWLYLFVAAATFTSVLAFTQALCRNIWLSIICAVGACAVFFNYALLVDYFSMVIPQFVSQLSMVYFACAAALRGVTRSPYWLAVAVVLLLAAVAMEWLFFVFFGGLLLVIGALLIALALDSERPAKRLAWLLGSVAAFGIVLYLSGIPSAFRNAGLMSDRLWDPNFMTPNSTVANKVDLELSLWGGIAHLLGARVLAAAGLLGAAYQALLGAKPLRILGCATLLVVLVLGWIDFDAAGSNVYWMLPAPQYFERPLFPLYVIFAVVSLVHLLGIVLRAPAFVQFFAVDAGPPRRRIAKGAVAFSGIVLGLLLALLWVRPHGDWAGLFRQKPYYWDVVTRFAADLKLPPITGTATIGYLFDATRHQAVGDCPQFADNPASRSLYCAYMFARFGVPYATEFKDLVDLQGVATRLQLGDLTNRLRQSRSEIVASAARAFGLRYVALDGVIPAAARSFTANGEPVSILDLGAPTAADISIGALRSGKSYDLDEVVSGRINKLATIYERAGPLAPNAFAPVTSFRFELGHGFLTVEASSPGESVMLLPFQYSHCLRVRSTGQAELMRVDGVQAALRFRQHVRARIENTFRFFGDADCRRQDFADAMRSGMWPILNYDQIVKGRRVPWLMRTYLRKQIRLRNRILAGQP